VKYEHTFLLFSGVCSKSYFGKQVKVVGVSGVNLYCRFRSHVNTRRAARIAPEGAFVAKLNGTSSPRHSYFELARPTVFISAECKYTDSDTVHSDTVHLDIVSYR
jgi:hypothetical protein